MLCGTAHGMLLFPFIYLPRSPDVTNIGDTLTNPSTCITGIPTLYPSTSTRVLQSPHEYLSTTCIIEHYTGENRYVHHTSSSERGTRTVYHQPMHSSSVCSHSYYTAVISCRAPTNAWCDERVRGARWKSPRRNHT